MSGQGDTLGVVVMAVILAFVFSDVCDEKGECGWKASCTNQSVCTCPLGLTLHTDGKNCRNGSCNSIDCLECLDTASICTRCVSFMSSSSGLCLRKCQGSAELKGNNIMCTESEDDSREVDIVLAVVSGVGTGTVLCVLIIMGVCCYMRKTRKKINLQTQSYRNGRMEIGHVKQFPAFDNSAFESESQVDYSPGKIDPLGYIKELDRLRPHADTLMALLSEVKAKTRAMNSSDPRVSTYKGVIHQLCRVLVLLHKKDPVVSIPSDALSLLHWAQQMLDDHREQQSSSGGTEYPMARISAVDEEVQNPTSPVYATPNDNSFGQQRSPLSQLANPYSSVPVPLPSKDDSNQQRAYRNSGYATIRRTPSIPNGELLKSMEDGHHAFPVIEMEPVNVSSFSSPHQGAGFLHKEDFHSFLINNGKTSSDEYSTVNRKKNVDDGRRQSRQEPPPEIFNTFSESYGDIDFSGGYLTQPLPSQAAIVSRTVSRGEDNVVLHNKDKSIKSGPGLDTGTPPIKKNIITNPNAIQKPSVSKGNNFKSSSSVGYFANGHFYDPNPSPMPEPETEVYAPGSSYSERSNVMSTFLGDLPLSRSPSESEPSDDGNAESDNSGGDLDVFPFDPNEVTNPVEV